MITLEEKIKKSKYKLGEKIPCVIEVLTPVHIGSGVKLKEGIDFIKTNESVYIVPQSELLKYLEDNPYERENFIKGNYSLKALKKIPVGKKYPLSSNTNIVSEILQFERNGNGDPYIPGSSIKGAIRTVLLKKRFEELKEKFKLLYDIKNNNRVKKEFASEFIVKKCFGESSNKNLMRVLEVFDAEFCDVELREVFILSLTNNNGNYGWKELKRKINSNNPKDASPVVVETLPIGSKAHFSIVLNKFLLDKNTLQFNENSLNDIRELGKLINRHSKDMLTKEIEFFDKFTSSKKLTSLTNTLQTLLNSIDRLNNNEFILRMGWGSGWKGMTGDYLDNLKNKEGEEWVKIFRKKFNMGKRDFPIFPKTRRIVFENNEPKYLTGWVKIKLYEK